jgi:hypothetical protein
VEGLATIFEKKLLQKNECFLQSDHRENWFIQKVVWISKGGEARLPVFLNQKKNLVGDQFRKIYKLVNFGEQRSNGRLEWRACIRNVFVIRSNCNAKGPAVFWAGWPDWANFRLLVDCLLREFVVNGRTQDLLILFIFSFHHFTAVINLGPCYFAQSPGLAFRSKTRN